MLIAIWILLVIGGLAAASAVKALFDGELDLTKSTDIAAITWVAVSLYVSINSIFFGA